MKRHGICLLCLTLTAVVLAGCNPRIRVRKSPGPRESGIRYYRPKPYLLVTPADASLTVVESKTETRTPSLSDEFVSIELQYLPDFAEEYALDVRPGLGTADVSFTLKDGWMLTEVNQKLDSQFDENVKATAELLKAGAGILPTGGVIQERAGEGVEVTKKWVVAATNVPLGYYESVISRGAGGKTLAGWRYVGFAPFNSCSTVFCGTDAVGCSDPHAGPVYGLAFSQGVMTFRRLDVLQSIPDVPLRVEVPTGFTQNAVLPSVHLSDQQLQQLERQIASEIETSGTGVDMQVRIARNSDANIDWDYIASVSFKTLLDSNSLSLRLQELEGEIKNMFPASVRVRIDLTPTALRTVSTPTGATVQDAEALQVP